MANRHSDGSGRDASSADRPSGIGRIALVLVALCAALFAADFLYHKHGYLEIEEIVGFYPLFGLLASAALVIVAAALRLVLKRPEDFYAPKDVESEAYPEDQIEKVDADA